MFYYVDIQLLSDTFMISIAALCPVVLIVIIYGVVDVVREFEKSLD